MRYIQIIDDKKCHLGLLYHSDVSNFPINISLKKDEENDGEPLEFNIAPDELDSLIEQLIMFRVLNTEHSIAEIQK